MRSMEARRQEVNRDKSRKESGEGNGQPDGGNNDTTEVSFIFIHFFIYKSIKAHTYTCMRAHIQTHKHKHTHKRVCTHTCAPTRAHTHIHKHTHTRAHKHAYQPGTQTPVSRNRLSPRTSVSEGDTIFLSPSIPHLVKS